MALCVVLNDDGSYELKGIWDYRDDPEGIIYDLKNSDEERIAKFKKNRDNVHAEYMRHTKREEHFGVDHNTYGVEPIPNDD